MFFVYFSIPIITGYHVMQWAISKSEENLGAQGEILRSRKSSQYYKHT